MTLIPREVDGARFTTKLTYDGTSERVQYVGTAYAGTATTAKAWMIKKLTYDVSNRLTDVQWANGDAAFNFVWDSKASYTYS